MTTHTYTVPMPPLTSADPAHAYNHPYTVTDTLTGTLAPFVSAWRSVHVTAWLRESDLETVVQAWMAAQEHKP